MTWPEMTPESVYLHIPFCTNKCHYCDFNSYVLKGQPVMDYLDAMEREMERTVRAIPPGRIRTFFVGGGTPTVLTPEQMESFLKRVAAYFPDRTEDVEFTMEANPGTVDPDKLAAMKEGGVNRVSFGAQSFDNALLERIGRIHEADDVIRSIENARAAGFENLSIDLMFGLPGQTLEILDRSLDTALSLDLRHYSIYGLKVEENTLFHTLYMRDRLPLPAEEEEAAMFGRIMERLGAAGYEQYEISNFAKPGYASQHNCAYWENRAYYGIGAGSHGYARGERHMNIKGVNPYIEASKERLPRLETSSVSKREAMEDFMMVGLRKLAGIRDVDFRAQFGESFRDVFRSAISKEETLGRLVATEDGYRLSDQGIFLGNEVFAEFIGE
ncbi:radical SAM family heme chaperone HemW [Gorillibacterium sp. CAU 1737]|uniref:radical SAM family heme chaperone HemW n=1 Tax=Gorillibacterium sp. CAU 1737 TaxID=3140362 RepID=UPI003260012B